jgi:hypothetical protein
MKRIYDQYYYCVKLYIMAYIKGLNKIEFTGTHLIVEYLKLQ